MNLRTLSYDEFLRYAVSEIDDLTSSDLERELLRRLEAVDTDTFNATQELEFTSEDLQKLSEAGEDLDIDEQVQILNAVKNQNMAVGNVVQVLKMISDLDIEYPDDLKEIFEFAAKFRAIANDAGDVIDRINTLINDTQE